MLPYCRSIHNVIEYKISSQHTVVNNFFLVIFFSVFVDKSSKKAPWNFFSSSGDGPLFLKKPKTIFSKSFWTSLAIGLQQLCCSVNSVYLSICLKEILYPFRQTSMDEKPTQSTQKPLWRANEAFDGGLCLAVWQSSFVGQILNLVWKYNQASAMRVLVI